MLHEVQTLHTMFWELLHVFGSVEGFINERQRDFKGPIMVYYFYVNFTSLFKENY